MIFAAPCILGAVLCAPPADDFTASVEPFLEAHCLRCHGPEKSRGGLRLDELEPDFETGPVDLWLEVVERLTSAEMPPPDEAHLPTPEEAARVATWITQQVAEGEAARLASRGRVSLLRLSREEYARTIEDLLGVTLHPEEVLVENDRWQGFERIGSVLSLSPTHVERAYESAARVLMEALPDRPPASERIVRTPLELIGGREILAEGSLVEDREQEVRIDLWPGQDLRVRPHGPWIGHAGTYRMRVRVSGVRARDGRAPHLTVRAATLDRLLFASDVEAPEEGPRALEFEFHLPAGEHEFVLANDLPGPPILARIGRAGAPPFFSLAEGRIPWQVQLLDDDTRPIHPVLILDQVEWEGPLEPALDAEAFVPTEDAEAHARLEEFAELAFRRPPTAEELEPYLALLRAERARGVDLRTAFRTTLQAVLCSKDFLHLVEGTPDRDRATLTSWELASRLSYFLWSTMPDTALRELARSGELLEPVVLRREVRRMLADPRSQHFVESFSMQWLQLQRVGMFTPDSELYPEYDGSLERSMVRETQAFFGQVLETNAGLVEFLDSNWTMLDERLARHYGVDGVRGSDMRRVSLGEDRNRGGLLTHASVLSLTSDGTRHRPVHRGVWFFESILGRSVTPPPANVDPIEPTPLADRKQTVRERLEAHVADPTCAACHRSTDPLGFAFENFDAIGRWRTREDVPTGTGEDPAVDASGVLADGRSFAGIDEFRSLLLEDLDVFAAAFTSKLATYALRRPLGVDDRDELERITSSCAATDYRLQSLIEELVLSDLFLRR